MNKQIIILLSSIFFSSLFPNIWAQTLALSLWEEDTPGLVAEPSSSSTTSLLNAQATEAAVFYELEEYLSLQLEYPELAREQSREGRVVLRFIVDEQGEVEQISVVSALGMGCDEAAIEALSNMPKWQPATFKGQAISVVCYLPIDFRLR